MQGMFHKQVEDVADIAKSYESLEKAGQKDRTKVLITATQEQACAQVHHTRQTPM